MEQRRISKFLHKTVGQTVSAARLLVSTMERKVPAGNKELTDDFRRLGKWLVHVSTDLQKLIRSLAAEEPPTKNGK